MKNIAFTGSFDPITKGHLWVAQEALELADKLILIIATNPAKKYYFTESERVLMIKESLKEYGIENKVDVVVVRNEYVSQVALDYDCKYLIRGLRSSIDFDYEAMIQKANTEVLDGAKTIFVMPPRDLESISSSFIKGLIGPVGWHWKIKNFVSKGVYDALIIKYLKESISKYTNLKLD
jgi:pantetheine-phosphate adenylyltransferase